jgi:pheromone a factor receptor
MEKKCRMSPPNLLVRSEPQFGPPQPNLGLNLFFRIFLGIVSSLACLVPAKLLWRNGELAAVAFCCVVVFFDWLYLINAIMWPSDNTSRWWDGRGWCDLQMYLILPMQTEFICCVFAVMRNLAQQVGLMRVWALTAREKRRHNIKQAILLFTVPSSR